MPQSSCKASSKLRCRTIGWSALVAEDGHQECAVHAPCSPRYGTRFIPGDCSICDMWPQHLIRVSSIDWSSTHYKALSHRWSMALKWANKCKVHLKWADSTLGVRLGITWGCTISPSPNRQEPDQTTPCQFRSRTQRDSKHLTPFRSWEVFPTEEQGPSGTQEVPSESMPQTSSMASTYQQPTTSAMKPLVCPSRSNQKPGFCSAGTRPPGNPGKALC